MTSSNSCWPRPRAGIARRSTTPSAPARRLDARLSRAVNVYWTYITAWVTPDGTVNFRDDIYERDGIEGVPVASAPGEALPVH